MGETYILGRKKKKERKGEALTLVLLLLGLNADGDVLALLPVNGATTQERKMVRI